MNKLKLLCILHRSPPRHGAAKVGDFISESKKLQEEYTCRFITIKSSDSIGDIGKVNFKKIYLLIELYFRVLFTLLSFRPNKIYFTSSINGVAFYRDMIISTLWKIYSKFISVDIYYHYHTKGINNFISSSNIKLKLTNFFLKDVNIFLLSPLLKDDFIKIDSYKSIQFLPNGVENNYTNAEFNKYISNKNLKDINILYLSNMIKSKGYFEVLKLAKHTKNKNYHYHFAGGWQTKDEEKEFFKYIQVNNLEKIVTFHGFVNGEEKKELFKNSSLLLFPTRYPLESFGLVIIESFSYGVPVLSTNEGSIPYIIDDKSGIVIDNLNKLEDQLEVALENFINVNTSQYCRTRYLENFSLDTFEVNLLNIFNSR